ncbi:hypothetical protein BSKO_02208 [Bryopsis sp. KO-2023]|nr:hypothetical protein BSKO_02208 [Bryopsis sp. KO-2023]
MSAAHLVTLLSLSMAAICGGARVTYGGGQQEAVEALVAGDHPPGFDSQLRKLLQAAPANALFAAAFQGDLAAVQQEIAKGSDVNAKDSAGITPLGAAVVSQNFEVMRALVAAGADVSATSSSGELIHVAAVIQNNAEGLTILLDGGADVNSLAAGLLTPLLMAVTIGDKSNIELLLSRDATFDRAIVEPLLCSCVNFDIVPACNTQGCQNDKASLLALFD